MKTTTEMQLVPIAKLVPYVNNARTHSPEQITKLRSSLREFGFINPVIIDRDFNVIAGHGRILAAKEEDITEVPCVFADHLSEAQKKAYIIADNRMAMDAGWDEELLRVEIESLQGMDFDPLLTGFDEKELADLFADDSGSEARDDDFDLTAALEKASFVERGDVWTVGRHRLVCGDATSAEDVAKLMDGRKANLIVTDPPYGVSFKSSSGLTIQNDSMKDEEFYNFLLSAFQCMAEHLEKGGAAYVFHADTEGLNFRKAFIDAGFHLAGVCIWVKNSLVLGRSDYQWQHEPVLYGFLQNGKHPWYSDRKQTTIWNYDKPKRNANHPTSKPLNLLGYSRMEQEITDLGKEIARLERQEALEAELNRPVNKPLTGKPMNGKEDTKTGRAADEYRRNFWNMMRSKAPMPTVLNALEVGTDSEGGYLVPDEYERTLVEALEEENVFRQLAKVIQTSSGDRKIPVVATKGTASWIDEEGAYTESDDSFGQVSIGAYKLGTMIKVSEELLNDSVFDLESYISREFARRIGAKEEEAFFTGDGSGKPLGILAASGGAETGITAASATAITADELIDLFYSLKAPYRRNAVWLLNDSTIKAVRKLKDGSGQYLWQPSLTAGTPDIWHIC